jgi:hypothetical protein
LEKLPLQPETISSFIPILLRLNISEFFETKPDLVVHADLYDSEAILLISSL